MEIKPLSMGDQLRMIRGVEEPQEQTQAQGKSFSDFFADKLEELNTLGLESDRAIERRIEGKEANPHSTLLALQRAEISFQLMMSVKQKIEQAYQEIIRTPV